MNKNLLAVLIGGGALLAWTLSKADDEDPLNGARIPGTPGELPGSVVPPYVPPAGNNTSQVPGTVDMGLGPETLPGSPQCSPCSGSTPFTLIGPGGAPCAGCIGSPILPFPFHFMVGSPLPIPGYYSLPDPGYAV